MKPIYEYILNKDTKIAKTSFPKFLENLNLNEKHINFITDLLAYDKNDILPLCKYWEDKIENLNFELEKEHIYDGKKCDSIRFVIDLKYKKLELHHYYKLYGIPQDEIFSRKYKSVKDIAESLNRIKLL